MGEGTRAGATRNVGAEPGSVPVQREGISMLVGLGVVGMAAVASLVVPQLLTRWFRAAAGKGRPMMVKVVVRWTSVGFVRLSASMTVWLWRNVPILVVGRVDVGT